jgi:hypothetical protein
MIGSLGTVYADGSYADGSGAGTAVSRISTDFRHEQGKD